MRTYVTVLGWLQIALGVLDLLMALAVYTFWVLLHDDTRRLFGRA
ncbi:MAG: hypothetical protein ACOC8B_00245 [Gemmatimonadota bacterium]